ncbi:type II toxin-antitoxin system RelE/ParE family toxin [Streptomyces turgidiscabies]|uniref:Toxin-antitoxin system, toxin component, RelE domain protein n=1 Tax=Streptomyces turgidiscabies (strain Car8) TaxID=698760 RepID=L7FIN8_STRT8|nr:MULTISPECIES: type II toxin-antitoxin system RelE/ParE family toxin [Streptomyces]ELP71248.1 toxin-antitoxin system, toxin component, RelE domain protein [Streptomyces turgidiscabies Car8]MDX3498780.1 type II toxin-antitoxin system RelE/ParE family toxin [Streptomyces turgidiscabies]
MPDTPRHPVRFTDAAVSDLADLHRRDPQIARAVLRKVLLLERDPYAGRPLVGDLVGWRKLVVGDRHWRIVWRVVEEADGTTSVEVSEVWAVGPRENSAVYDELRARLSHLSDTQAARDLRDLLDRFGLDTGAATPPPADPVPDWLSGRLTDKAGLPQERVLTMSLEEAIAAWEDWMSQPRD